MSKMTPREMAAKLAEGLLSFPVTHFDSEFNFNEKAYRDHYQFLAGHKVSGLFAAGGTGEFFSLTPGEVQKVIKAGADEVGGKIPLIAGAGYGTRLCIEMAQAAEQAGADGILLFPPYLLQPSQEGLFTHIDAICKALKIGVIYYHRENGPVITAETIERLCDANPNFVGYKDGIGEIELMMDIYLRMGDRLTYIGGPPTAETYAVPFLTMGVTTYSSAIFNFMPEWALKFYAAVRSGDHAFVHKQLRDFVMPYIGIRNRGKGYAVSIVKAGLKAIGRDPGPVRLPLSDLKEQELAELKVLIDRAQASL